MVSYSFSVVFCSARGVYGVLYFLSDGLWCPTVSQWCSVVPVVSKVSLFSQWRSVVPVVSMVSFSFSVVFNSSRVVYSVLYSFSVVFNSVRGVYGAQ